MRIPNPYAGMTEREWLFYFLGLLLGLLGGLWLRG